MRLNLADEIARQIKVLNYPKQGNGIDGMRVDELLTYLQQIQKHINRGYKYVVDMDLEKFFDKVNHDILMHLIAKKIEDKRLLKLIRKYLISGIMINGALAKSEEGAPQGGPLSPLLSNILLDELDKEVETRAHRFCRYADDCNIYVKSKRAGERVLKNITKFLEQKLKLKVNTEKSAVSSQYQRVRLS